MKRFSYLMLLMLISSSIFSQNDAIKINQIETIDGSSKLKSLECGTPEPTAAQYAFTRDSLSRIKFNRNSGTTAIPIRAVIVRTNSGTGGISLENLNIGLANLNNHYLASGIEFFYSYDSPVYLDNSTYYDYSNGEESAMFTAANEVSDASNICFVNEVCYSGNCGVAGYAYFPFNAQQSTRIVMRNSATAASDNGTYAHEFGHWFSLYHTHQDTEYGNDDPDAENVPRTGPNSNCSMAGDLLCDTEADPNGSNNSSCQFINNGQDTQDENGNTYDPDISNIMSYYSDGCGGYFTQDQSDRMAQGLIQRLGFTNITLDRDPATVTNPSNLSLTYIPNSYTLQLNWNDNANNEMGYIIERSTTSASAGFQALQYGGVSENTSSFEDNDLSSITNYWYRVKASNDNPNHYSNVVSYSTGLIYCIPSYFSNSCDQGNGVGISRFELDDSSNNSLIDNNNGACAAFTNYSGSFSANVIAGSQYNFSVTRLDGFPQSVSIFIDLNRDGDFDDASEQVYQGSTGTYSGSFILPISTLNGISTMRVRTRYNATIQSPCAFNDFGETEDYGLDISGGLPVSLVRFEGQKNENAVKLIWATSAEIDNDYFSIQKSLDGDSFEEIGQVKGAGNIQIESVYEFADMDVHNGSYYYRLKQVDYDGRYDLSKTIHIDFQDNSTISIHPIPTNDQINLTFQTKQSGTMSIDIIDINGKMAKKSIRSFVRGENQVRVDVSKLLPGTYFARITSKDKHQILRFIIQ